MHEVPTIVFLKLPVFWGIDLSITGDVVLVWMATLVTFLVVFFACRRVTAYASGVFQNLMEEVIMFVDQEVVRGMMGSHASGWAPFILTLFFFILFANLLGNFPLPALLLSHMASGVELVWPVGAHAGNPVDGVFTGMHRAITSNINFTAALAVAVFIISQAVDVHRNGPVRYLKRIVPSGLPGWIMPFLYPLEIVARLARPFSLTLRLCANMVAGHAIGLSLIGLGISTLWFLKPLPYIGAVCMGVFEVFVCFIQAFVFTILSGFYIGEALGDAH
jgi:F-type H+-transporting ATPase subunit a